MPSWILVLLVTAVAGTAQTVAGFGFALLAVPLFVTFLGVVDAVALGALLGIVNAGLVARAAFRHVPWPTVRLLLFGSVCGMPLGLAVLLGVSADTLRLAVAIVSVAMTAAILAGFSLPAAGALGTWAVGVVSGVLSTSTGINGPPVVLFLQALGHPPTVFRGALSTFFVTNGVVSISMLAVSGVIGRRVLGLALVALPVLFGASWLGHRVLPHFSTAAFRHLVLGLLVLSAVTSLLDALWHAF